MMWPWRRVQKEKDSHKDLEQAFATLEAHEKRIKALEMEWNIIKRMPSDPYDGPDRRRIERQ